ncbi:MAG: InlB B-repeat-containing protein [Bacillus subtilis]|nr:InlB B-repeat-containing protein [Bacillus subtilis]
MIRKGLLVSLALVVVAASILLFIFVKPSFNVEFRDEDATLLLQVDVKKGEDALPPDNPSKLGYTFSGWDADYRDIQNDLVLTATYTVNNYTISFQVDGGSAVPTITQNYLTAVTAPAAPTKTGYTFAGWYRELALTTPYVFATMPAVDSTVYAKWSINQIAIAFEENGGSVVEDLAQDYGTVVAAPTAPTKVGHMFGGWYSDETFTTPYVFSTMPAQSITLYAKWTIIAYTVTFENHDGTVLKTESVNYGFNATPPANPSRIGYTFLQWSASYTDITANVTVTATYAINPYTISFDSNGGSVVDSMTQNYQTDRIRSRPTDVCEYDFPRVVFG